MKPSYITQVVFQKQHKNTFHFASRSQWNEDLVRSGEHFTKLLRTELSSFVFVLSFFSFCLFYCAMISSVFINSLLTSNCVLHMGCCSGAHIYTASEGQYLLPNFTISTLRHSPARLPQDHMPYLQSFCCSEPCMDANENIIPL